MEANMLNDLWKQHGWVLLFVAWPVLTMLLNVALRKKTPEQWVAYANQNPRTAALIRLISATGLDPTKAMRAIQQLVKGAADKAHAINPKAAALIDAVAEEPKETPKS